MLARNWAAARPPLPLAAATVAAFWGAAYTAGRWIDSFVTYPVHEDIRFDYVAAEAGLRFGWSKIYDFGTLRLLSEGFPQASINSGATYISPPPLALLFTPLTAFSEPVAYLAWTVVSVAAIVFAWHATAPAYGGMGRIALLLAGLALWPVYLAFYYGQPELVILALVAGAWWLMRRNHAFGAGALLAVALSLKPQVVFMVPLCLLAAGRIRPVAACAAAAIAIGAVSAALLEPAGIASYWSALKLVQSDPQHSYFTISYLFGNGAIAYVLLALQGAMCLAVAWRRRDSIDVTVAVGLLGSLMVSFHLHQPDYANLLLAAWLVLRGAPSMLHKAWLAAGFVTMQVLTFGQPAPQLAWNLVWLLILGFESQNAEENAGQYRLQAEGQQHGGRDDLAHGQARI